MPLNEIEGLKAEVESLTRQLEQAKSERDSVNLHHDAACKAAGHSSFSSRPLSETILDIVGERDEAQGDCAFLRNSMQRAASAPGCEWLEWQLQLANDLAATDCGNGFVPKAELDEALVFKRRLEWLHQGSGIVDSEGYEWGVARVKFVNGNPASVLWTLSDHSDLDAEIAHAEAMMKEGK